MTVVVHESVQDIVDRSPELQQLVAGQSYSEMDRDPCRFPSTTFSWRGKPLGKIYRDVDDMWSADRDLVTALRCEIHPCRFLDGVKMQVADAVYTYNERNRP